MVIDESLVCYIRDMNTNRRVTFNIEKPEGYTDTYTANFQQQNVRGRDNPFQSYIDSGPRQVSFTVLVALDYRRDLAEQTESIRNMLKPYKSGGSNVVTPPKVQVKIGKALHMEAIPVSFSAEWTGGYKEGVYRLCTWSFSFTEVNKNSKYNQSDTGLNNDAIIPIGLEYIPVANYGSGMSSGESEAEINVGDTYSVSEDVLGYMTANEALNNKADGEYTTIESGEYYVSNTKGDALALSIEPEGEVVGWLVPEN